MSSKQLFFFAIYSTLIVTTSLVCYLILLKPVLIKIEILRHPLALPNTATTHKKSPQSLIKPTPLLKIMRTEEEAKHILLQTLNLKHSGTIQTSYLSTFITTKHLLTILLKSRNHCTRIKINTRSNHLLLTTTLTCDFQHA